MFRAMDKWLVGYLRSALTRPAAGSGPLHVMFCVADHFEPFRGGVDGAAALATVGRWVSEYPRCFAGYRDADGMPPRHTFFYPQEEYDPACLDALTGLCAAGWGEVEIHLHHRHDTAGGLRGKLVEFRDRLRNAHGCLGSDRAGGIRYGFVHGNWALCNARPDGDWCGVNEELGILQSTGCYADFTFPSAPSPTQPRVVNAIYYATDIPGRPRASDRGVPARAGDHSRAPSGLMLIQGPLALNWRWRKWGVLPRLENGEISGANPPTHDRIRLWALQHIHVRGRPDWIFIKVHTHGCVPANMDMLLGEAMRRAHDEFRGWLNAGQRCLHYVTAREMYNIVRAAEHGCTGLPGAFRDWEIARPPCAG